MKTLKTLGLVAGIVSMCGMFAFAGSVISHWDDPVLADKPAVSASNSQKGQSSIQAAAVASAQESTDLTQ